MKKLLSLILLVIILITTMPIVMAEDSTYRVGDIIRFGSYPQSQVEDTNLISTLNSLAPKWEDWTSYGYYSGKNETGSMVQNDDTRYTDISYNGCKYRGVKFIRYRAGYTDQFTSETGNQKSNGFLKKVIYWFKFEDLNWRVIDPKLGLIVCNTIIDSQPYSNTIYYKSGLPDYTYGYYNDIELSNYANNYETSSIRKWLNSDFYYTAFTVNEYDLIETSKLNNFSVGTLVGDNRYNIYDSNSTNDKIFLLSFDEVTNSSYGFSSKSNEYDINREAKSSDYAQIQGLHVTTDDYSQWLLRSSGDTSYYCSYVMSNGYVSTSCNVDSTSCGIRPALKLKDIENYNHKHKYVSYISTPPTHIIEGTETYICYCGETYTKTLEKTSEHLYNAVITKPTCTEQGFTTYTCECGDIYVSDYVDMSPHTYVTVIIEPTCLQNGYTIYTCACGNNYINTAIATGHTFNGSECVNCDFNKAETCSCNCHKSGLIGIVWKIIIIFNKLLRKNQLCNCGITHY